MESIDNRSDFRTFMQNYAFAHGGASGRGGLRRNAPRDEPYVSLTSVFCLPPSVHSLYLMRGSLIHIRACANYSVLHTSMI